MSLSKKNQPIPLSLNYQYHQQNKPNHEIKPMQISNFNQYQSPIFNTPLPFNTSPLITKYNLRNTVNNMATPSINNASFYSQQNQFRPQYIPQTSPNAQISQDESEDEPQEPNQVSYNPFRFLNYEDKVEVKKPEPLQLNMPKIGLGFKPPTITTRVLEMKKKYSCSCKRSKCLKLYCDCFTNGEVCFTCNCQGCANVIGNEIEIRKTFSEVKGRNPIAMKLNMTEETTALGCNCTRSYCSKKYCECFKARLACTDLCRCRDCDNHVKGSGERKQKEVISISNNIVNVGMLQAQFKSVNSKYYFQKTSIEIQHSAMYIDHKDIISPNDFIRMTMMNKVNSEVNINNEIVNSNKGNIDTLIVNNEAIKEEENEDEDSLSDKNKDIVDKDDSLNKSLILNNKRNRDENKNENEIA